MTYKEFKKILGELEDYEKVSLFNLNEYYARIEELEKKTSLLRKEVQVLSGEVKTTFLDEKGICLFIFYSTAKNKSIYGYKPYFSSTEILQRMNVKRELEVIVADEKERKFLLKTHLDGSKTWEEIVTKTTSEEFIQTIKSLKKPTFFELQCQKTWYGLEFYPIEGGVAIFDHDDETFYKFSNFKEFSESYDLPDNIEIVERKLITA